MRQVLEPLSGQQVIVEGKCRERRKHGILFMNLNIDGHRVTDHCWVTPNKNGSGVTNYKKIRAGRWYTFRAVVTKYARKDGSEDYGLEWVNIA